MDVAEFVNAVTPTVGERCPVGGCAEWVNRTCAGRCPGGFCLDHCTCEDESYYEE